MPWIRKRQQDTDWRDITSQVPVPVTSGRLLLARFGSTAWLEFEALLVADPPSGSFHSWGSGTIPQGFRPSKFHYRPLAPQFGLNTLNYVTLTAHASGPVRIAANGGLIVYGAKRGDNGNLLPIQGLVSWPTLEVLPTTLPGVSA